MSLWTVQVDKTADNRYRWRHVPAEGTGEDAAHSGNERFDTPEAAREAGQRALDRHHEQALDASTADSSAQQAPELDAAQSRQAELDRQQQAPLSPLGLSNLPIEAQVRDSDMADDVIRR